MRTLLFSTLVCLATTAQATEPSRFFPDDLGQDGRITLAPGFSPDGQTIYFAQSEGSPIWKYPQRLKVSHRTATGWTTPALVPLPRGISDFAPRADFPSVTPDGRTLLFSWSAVPDAYADRDITDNFDLYSLDLTSPGSVPTRFETSDINRVREGRYKTIRYVDNENAPVLTSNGDLYFWGERLDGIGERDIYLAKADGQGGFQPAEPLQSPINTPGRDDGSWVSADGRLMLFSSSDRGGEGESDIFLSVNTDGIWSEPVPLGPSINGRASEFAGRITPDGKLFVFNSTRAFGDTPEGLIQIWSLPVADIPVLANALSSLD